MDEKRRTTATKASASRQRLPTLAEVLARHTLAPVDLYCFYLYLQREGAEDSLDFWLDVQQHETLCKSYFQDLRKSGKSIQEEWPGYFREARERGSIYTKYHEDEFHSVDAAELEKRIKTQTQYAAQQSQQRASFDEYGERTSQTGPRFPGDPDFPVEGKTSRSERRSILAKRASLAPTVISRNAAITRTDLIASAERIYARYLLPGSEKEIYLPSALRINSFPISSNALPHPQDEESQRALARVPDMFHAQKE